MVKAGKRDGDVPVEDDDDSSVYDDVDELIMCLDCDDRPDEGDVTSSVPVESPVPVQSPGVPDDGNDSIAVPWLDRYETTGKLIEQLEETLTLMESKGVNLTEAWDLANTARSLLESADVIQALIFANRSFRLAMNIHRHGPTGTAAS